MGKKIGFSALKGEPDGEANEKEKKAKREPDPLSFELLNSFCCKYMPAEDIGHSTNQFSSEQITMAIASFSGDRNITNNHIKDVLLSKGYNYTVEIENFRLVFKWIVKERL
jgi:hypothetical protein